MPVTVSYDTSGIYTCTGHNKDVASALKTNSDNFTLTTGNRQISLVHFLKVVTYPYLYHLGNRNYI